MPPTPRKLILNLLLAAEGTPLSAADAVRACGFFGIRENSVRVALVRLSAEGLLTSAGRGAYQLGPGALNLAHVLASWRQAESLVRDWQGGWIMVDGLIRNWIFEPTMFNLQELGGTVIDTYLAGLRAA